MTDPDRIAETFTNEMSEIIEHLAPQRRIQLNKRNKIHMSKELKDEIKVADAYLTKATETLNTEDLRIAKTKQNKIKKDIEKEAAINLKARLKGKNKWKVLNEDNENRIPTQIINNGNDIRSPKAIADTFNEYFTNKIKDIRKNFDDKNELALSILSKLVEKPKTKFKFKAVTVYEVYEAISKSKNTNSSGKDGISMRILKDTQQFSARVITHMFNTIIFKKKYPSILKKAKVIPICKPGKPETEISSYRPISRLPTVDKVLQGLMRTQLESYFEGNKIITPEHHGGRQHHSTVSALGSIDLTNKTFKEKHKTVAI